LPTKYTLHTIPPNKKMKLLCIASLIASAGAFTSSPAAFTSQSCNVGQDLGNKISAASGTAHHNRRATIVMDGKANGEYVRQYSRRLTYL